MTRTYDPGARLLEAVEASELAQWERGIRSRAAARRASAVNAVALASCVVCAVVAWGFYRMTGGGSMLDSARGLAATAWRYALALTS